MRSTVSVCPSIITEGLTFYYDAANPTSYKGINTSWSDLTIGARQMTLTNGPTYSTQFGGGFIFSTASLQDFSIPSVTVGSRSFAVDVWFKAGLPSLPTISGNGYNGLISCGDIWRSAAAAQIGWSIGCNADTTSSYYGACHTSSEGKFITKIQGPDLTTGTVYHLFMQRDVPNQRMQLYVNSVFHSQVSLANSCSLDPASNIGSSNYVYSTPGNNNTYYAIKMYVGKVFSASEIAQNYEALKSRFGM